MRTEPINVFGNLTPATRDMLDAAQVVLTSWQLETDLSLEEGVLRLTFEGVTFPGEDVCDALLPLLAVDTTGKIDIIDREDWTLTRHLFRRGTYQTFVVDLNHVLDYSGH